MTSPNASARRPTIGLLTTGMWHSLSVELWRGVLNAAGSADANVICYAGDELRSHHEAFTEMPNVLYNLVSPERVDGLIIWTSTVGSVLSDADLRKSCDQFAPLPIICVGRRVEGYPLLASDSLGGVRLVLGHLIDHHGFRRVAYIRGPEDNIDAQQRFQVYQEVLQAHGIPFDPALVTPPAPWRTANENILVLLQQRHLRPGADFQAVMCVGDVVAARTVRTLQEHGVNVPQDVAVAGFDGEEAAKEASSLQVTTSPLMMFEQGHHAVDLILSRLRSEQIPAETILPAHLLIRQTCGCPSPVIARAAMPTQAPLLRASPPAGLWPAQLAARRAGTIHRLKDLLKFDTHHLASDWADQLWDAFVADLHHPQVTQFLPRLSALQEITMSAGFNRWGTWQDLLTVLRQEMVSALAGHAVLTRAESLWQQARLAIAESETRWQVYIQLHRRYQDFLLREAGQRFITLFDIGKLVEALAVELPRLHIVGTYLSLYEKPEDPGAGARLFFALNEKGISPRPATQAAFPTHCLVPEDQLPGDRAFALMLAPLFFREKNIGLAVFEASPGADEVVYDALPRLISSAVQGALLVQAITERDRELERLATTDTLTGIANRRQFFILAELDIQRARRYKRAAAVMMLDLDHFKQVNDSYGHAIGDEVLHTVAERLKNALRQTDLLGRYGGEEFVVLLSETGPELARTVAERLRKSIADEPIVTSGPIIPLTVSIGVASLDGDPADLSGLLNRADSAMYTAKNSGRNQVVCLNSPA
jgi:diguanylate cyclase (GGDEF)-like protein